MLIITLKNITGKLLYHTVYRIKAIFLSMPWIRNPDSQSVHKVIEYGSNPDPQPWSRIRIQSI
jgi:hypothetical protein